MRASMNLATSITKYWCGDQASLHQLQRCVTLCFIAKSILIQTHA